jgi:hypothetical protein
MAIDRAEFRRRLADWIIVMAAPAKCAERRVWERTPTVAELARCPLPLLYNAIFQAQRDRLRQWREVTDQSSSQAFHDSMMVLWMRWLGWSPARAHRQARLEQMLQRMLRWTNDVIDGEVPPGSQSGQAAARSVAGPAGRRDVTNREDIEARRAFFEHTTRVVRTFADGRLPEEEEAMTEDLPLVYLILGARRLLGLDVAPMLLDAWAAYIPNAERVLQGEPAPARHVLAQALRCYETLNYVAGLLLGLPDDIARRRAELVTRNNAALDSLEDLPDDARRGRLSVAREDLTEAGISPAAILANASSPAAVAGLADWAAAYATAGSREWKQALPTLEHEILPHIKSRIARNAMRSYWRARASKWAGLLRQWELQAAHGDPPEFTFEGDRRLPDGSYAALYDSPLGWRVGLTEVWAAAAEVFGIKAGSATRERWRRLAAFVWVFDHLLNDAPDRAAALDSFSQVVRDPAPNPAAIQGWLNENALIVFRLLDNSLAGLGTREHVFELLGGIFGDDARQKLAADTLDAYVQAVISEGARFGSAAAHCMTAEERAHPRFAAFERWCTEFATCFGLRDAYYRFADDYESGLVQVPPTGGNRRTFRCLYRRRFARLWLSHPRVTDALLAANERYHDLEQSLGEAATRGTR